MLNPSTEPTCESLHKKHPRKAARRKMCLHCQRHTSAEVLILLWDTYSLGLWRLRWSHFTIRRMLWGWMFNCAHSGMPSSEEDRLKSPSCGPELATRPIQKTWISMPPTCLIFLEYVWSLSCREWAAGILNRHIWEWHRSSPLIILV